MDRETARRKSRELEAAVNKAYSDVTAGKITDAKFNACLRKRDRGV